MDHIKVLSRGFEITWRYRALWVFGLILALVISSGGGNGGQYTAGGDDFQPPDGEFTIPEMPEFWQEASGVIIAIAIGLGCLLLLLTILAIIARYVARTAMIRMVDDHEETGERRSVGWGFRAGWSRAAWRLFLIDLLVAIPIALAFILLFGLALAPLLLWITENAVLGVLGTVMTVGLGFLVILLAIVVGIALRLLIHFIRRFCVLGGEGVVDSIRRGLDFGLRHALDIGIMALLLFGLYLVWSVLTVLVGALLLIAGILVGGSPALLAGLITSLVAGGPVPWIVAGLIGIPVLVLVVGLPLAFLEGLSYVYGSTTWTLTYRELRALDALEAAPTA